MTKIIPLFPASVGGYVNRLSRMLALVGLVLLGSGVFSRAVWAQTPTPGLIFKPATAGTPGTAVLDPNGDGYVSASPTGFTAAGDIGTLSEIPYRYLPQAITNEPNADLRVGPNHKFTDFADVAGGGNSVGFFVDANGNYMFRFRLGGAAPNSKGYSIAIDTDNKFGFTGPNADPDAVAGNPGFEMEILLASNFGVRLYNINGTVNPTGPGPDNSLLELPYESYAQKALAVTRNNGDLDVFYDFYMPLSVIQAAFGPQTYFNASGSTAVPFSLDTPLRMVANTIIAPHSVTQYQNISDVGGVNDADFPNPDLAFIKLIAGSTPTSGNGVPVTPGTTIPGKTTPPVVNAPIQQGATTISGTSVEVAGTVITVFVNGTALGTTTTVQSNGTWTLTGVPALATGALITATARAPTKSVSGLSNEVQVGGAPTCATASPVITCSSDRGVFGTAAPGASVYLRFPNGALVPFGGNKQVAVNPVTANSAGNFYFTTGGGNLADCNNGQPNSLLGTYLVSQVGGSATCESSPTLVCIGTAVATGSPVLTTPRPITASTTSLTGTAPANSVVTLSVDGNRFSSVTTSAGGAFTFSGAFMPTLTTGRVLTLTAADNNATCSSDPLTLNVVTNRTVIPPVVAGPLVTGTTTVAGTSVEAPGSTITLTTYANLLGTGAITGTYTTTVGPDGTWSVIVPARPANSSVKATVTPVDYGTSGFSNVVPVLDRTASIPVITGTYTEKGTSVAGTSASPVGSTITVYIDGGFPIGTTTVQLGGNWTLTGLSAGTGTGPAAYPALYAGGLLTATATETGRLPSLLSNQVPVGCANIANKSFTATAVCVNNAATFTVPNVEPGLIYSLQDATTGADLPTGVSRLGTGTGTSTLTLVTNVFATAGSYAIKLNAFSIGAINCFSTSAPFSLTVNPLPLARPVAAQDPTLTTFQAAVAGTNITVQSSQAGVSYQLVNTSEVPNVNTGAAQSGTGGTLTFPTGRMSTTRTSTSYAVVGTSVPGCTQTVGTQTVSYAGTLPVVLTSFDAKAVGTGTVLTWRTASEKNSARFEVERSLDGLTFASVATVAAQGNSSQPTDYQATDRAAATQGQVLYYRLQQVDSDGSAFFSPVRAVQFTGSAAAEALLYPNPSTGRVTLNMAALPAGSYTVSLVNATGQTVRTQQLAAGQEHALDLSALPRGMYVVRMTWVLLHRSLRLVKE